MRLRKLTTMCNQLVQNKNGTILILSLTCLFLIENTFTDSTYEKIPINKIKSEVNLKKFRKKFTSIFMFITFTL